MITPVLADPRGGVDRPPYDHLHLVVTASEFALVMAAAGLRGQLLTVLPIATVATEEVAAGRVLLAAGSVEGCAK